MSDIWERYHKIEKDRRDKQRDLMDEYDRTVYYPAVKAVREECGNSPEGHNKSKYHDNGLGWHWWYCGRCGAAHGKEQYRILDDGEE